MPFSLLKHQKKGDAMSENKRYTAGFAAHEEFHADVIDSVIGEFNMKEVSENDFFRGFIAGLAFPFIEEDQETHGVNAETYMFNAAANYFERKSDSYAAKANLSMLGIKSDLDKVIASQDVDQIIEVAKGAVDKIVAPLKGDHDER